MNELAHEPRSEDEAATEDSKRRAFELASAIVPRAEIVPATTDVENQPGRRRGKLRLPRAVLHVGGRELLLWRREKHGEVSIDLTISDQRFRTDDRGETATPVATHHEYELVRSAEQAVDLRRRPPAQDGAEIKPSEMLPANEAEARELIDLLASARASAHPPSGSQSAA